MFQKTKYVVRAYFTDMFLYGIFATYQYFVIMQTSNWLIFPPPLQTHACICILVVQLFWELSGWLAWFQ